MLKLGGKEKYLPLAVIFFTVVITTLVFFLRSPVLIVTDASFDMIYGHERLNQKKNGISRALFRRVIPVTVAETAGADLVSIAVEQTSRSSGITVFPYRYLSGAQHYKEKYPSSSVFVIGSEMSYSTKEDMYRAGLCAAVLAKGSSVLFFGEGNVDYQYWDAFVQGLRAEGHRENPMYFSSSSDYSSYSSFSEAGCVVLAGSAAQFLEKNMVTPIILFSWIDPAMTPHSVKVIFDDSPWALAADFVKKSGFFDSFDSGEEKMLVSSKYLVLGSRIKEKKDFRRIRRIIKAKF